MSNFLPVVILALATLSGLTVYVVRAVLLYKKEEPGKGPDNSGTEALWQSLEAFEKRTLASLSEITLALDEGIRRVDRAENRIQKTVTSARRLVREAGLEHAGIEAEAAELRKANAEGSEPLPAVPADVGQGRTVRIPGGRLQIGAA